jgi:hypothetical protein
LLVERAGTNGRADFGGYSALARPVLSESRSTSGQSNRREYRRRVLWGCDWSGHARASARVAPLACANGAPSAGITFSRVARPGDLDEQIAVSGQLTSD